MRRAGKREDVEPLDNHADTRGTATHACQPLRERRQLFLFTPTIQRPSTPRQTIAAAPPLRNQTVNAPVATSPPASAADARDDGVQAAPDAAAPLFAAAAVRRCCPSVRAAPCGAQPYAQLADARRHEQSASAPARMMRCRHAADDATTATSAMPPPPCHSCASSCCFTLLPCRCLLSRRRHLMLLPPFSPRCHFLFLPRHHA